MNRINTQSGFTFIELITVVAIVLILGVMTSIFYVNFFNQNAVLNTTDQLVGQLRKAQIYAMAGKNNSNWGVKVGSNKITLFSSTNSALDETFSVNPNITFGAFTQIVFTKTTGLPDATQSITISNGTNSKTVTVNAQGVTSR
jgi:prepilin-type N-terminal cleavage/methylation domain-containing protein